MNFLIWYKPWTWGGDILNSIVGGIESGIRYLFYMLASLIYQLVYYLYDMFARLCKSRILDADIIEKIADRIGLILGLVMLFIVVFSCIQMILDPDKISDKEKGAANIVKKILLVIVMLGTYSFVFNTLYKVQEIVVESNVVSKLLLPYDVKTEEFGGLLSSELFISFYHLNPNVEKYIESNTDVSECNDNVESLRESIRNGDGYDIGYYCLNEKVTNEATKTNEFVIDFNWLLIIAFGIAAIYFLFSYCISVGVRSIQLAFLEIISPMAIISYLSPKKDTMFEKWCKLYFSTYIDMFIRIVLINFIIFLIATVFESDGGWAFWESVGTSNALSDTFIKIIMIMALFTFAKKAPDLLKQLFPGSSSGIGFGASLKDMSSVFGIAGLGLGTTVGAIGGLAAGKGFAGRLGGALRGAVKGGATGFKAKDPSSLMKNSKDSYNNATKMALKSAERRANGGGIFASPFSNIKLANMEAEIEKNKQIQSALNEAKTEAKSEAIKKGSNYVFDVGGGHIANGKTLSELAVLKDSQTISNEERISYTEAYKKLEGYATDFNLEYGGVAKNGQVYFNSDGEINGVMQELADGSDFKVITDYSEIIESNSAISSGMERVLANVKGEVKLGERVKNAKDISKKAKDDNNSIISSKEYKQAKADSKK